MSNIANLVAFDGASTPVSHTFLPIGISDDANGTEARYRESLASVPVYGQPVVKIRAARRTKTGVYANSVQVDVPVMESVNGQNAAGYTAAPKVAHVVSCRFTMFAHERSDVNIRRLARQLTVNVLNGVSTSVAPVTTGAAPELLDQLVMPT